MRPREFLTKLFSRRLLYLPRLFSTRERVFIFALGLVALISGLILAGRLFLRITQAQPAPGGTLIEGVLEAPRFINPIYATSDTDRDLTNLVFSKLVTHDQSGNLVMDAAESVQISEDGKVYTVRLRNNVFWHDGQPLGAQDVLFTIKTIQDPDYQSPLRPNWQGVVVEKLNDQTLRFSLRQPYAPFIENLSLGILPAHLWAAIPKEASTISDLNLKPVGSGPYSFEKFLRVENGPISSYRLIRNGKFYRGGPYLKKIVFRVFKDEADMLGALRKGEITSFIIPTPGRLAEAEKIGLNIYSFRLPQIFAVFLNGNLNAALTRPLVRRALAQAIDREKIISQSVSRGVIVNSALPPGGFGFRDDILPLEFNLDEAQKILAQDGWKDEDKNGVLERSEGTGSKKKTTELTITLATAQVEELIKAAELIREMWQALGAKTDVRILPAKDLELSLIRPRAYQALLFGEVFGRDPDPFAFWHTSQLKDPGLNIALYSNPKVDDLLERARRSANRAMREELYRQFQRIVSDEVAAIFLYTPTRAYAAFKELQGIAIASPILPEDRFNQVNEWYIKTRRVLK